MLEKYLLTVLELIWNQRLGHKKTKLNICHHMLTSSTQLQNRSFHVIERTRTSTKCQKMKNARAKRAKILFFIIKYANLWGFCCRRRRGCLSSLMSSENVTSRFCNHFSIIQSHDAYKMCPNYPGIEFSGTSASAIIRQIGHLSSYAHVVRTTAKLVISRRGKKENVWEMFENEKCTGKACKTFVLHYNICKFEMFFLPSSSCFTHILLGASLQC